MDLPGENVAKAEAAVAANYRLLSPAEIIRTAETLERRVKERFPESGLGRVCGEVVRVCRQAEVVSVRLARPNYALRVAAGFFMMLLFAAILTMLAGLLRGVAHFRFDGVGELLQGLEAGVNDLVFIGIAIWFLSQLEVRWKRRRALQSLYTLRSLAHIIDMHQLTKDPERVMGAASLDTVSSPKRVMTPFQLARYLDYCSEALALLSKSAALHVQSFDDRDTLDAVGEIEDLVDGLSRKIWQKITLLDRVAPVAGGGEKVQVSLGS